MGQIQLTISLVMIGLFTIAILGFGLYFAHDNGAPINIANDSSMTSLYTRSAGNVSSFSSGAESQYQSIVETTIEPESGVAPSTGPFAITPVSALGAVQNIMRVGYTRIFGAESGFNVFLVAFTAIILFLLGLYLYKTLRGLPD